MTNQFFFLGLIATLVILPIIAFRRNSRWMLRFCFYMTMSHNVRKFFCYNLLLAVILFHFVYYNTYHTEWGLMVSSIPMFMMFYTRGVEYMLMRLNDNRKEMWIISILTLMVLFTPHLFTLGITYTIVLIGAVFYPSRIMRSIDPYMVSSEYSRAMITRNYSRMIGCYFGENY